MKKRGWVIFFVFFWSFLGIGLRLCYLALGTPYEQAQIRQSSYTVTVDLPRGTVFDREGVPITNREQEMRQSPVPEGWNISGLWVACRQGFSTVQPAVHLVGYLDGQGRGVSGLQKEFDSLLQGIPTTVTYTVNGTYGVVEGIKPLLEQNTAQYEKGVVTTLLYQLQKKGEEVFPSGKRGAVAVSCCATGELLCAASFPGFSPKDVAASLESSASPLLNRLFCEYNVGSVFKLCVAAAALEQGISPSYSYCCQGSITAGVEFGCHNNRGHGTLTMFEALAVSCNPYFIHLAEKVGARSLYRMAVALGFGIATPLGETMVGEGGFLPTPETLASPASLANFAIGQGDFMATPLQIQTLTAAIANGGVRFAPNLVLGTRNQQGKTAYRKGGQGVRVMKQETADTLREMMGRVMTHGTGQKGYEKTLPSGGKTSTAETGMVDHNGQGVKICWFTGFYPLDNPRYAVTVVVEEGLSGGDTAAPVFLELCRYLKGLL